MTGNRRNIDANFLAFAICPNFITKAKALTASVRLNERVSSVCNNHNSLIVNVLVGGGIRCAHLSQIILSFIALLTASFSASAQGQDIIVVSDTTMTSAQANARIDFKVNLINVENDYHGNDAQLEKVLTEIDSMVLNPRMKVERITVVGTASPEGPYQNNVRLATGRAKAFIKILQSRYSFPDSIYAVSTIPED